MAIIVPKQPANSVVGRRGILAIFALLIFALVSTTLVRLTGVGASRLAPAPTVESRDLRFADGERGTVLVFDASDQRLIDTMPAGSNGFVRVVLRGLARERKLGDIGPQPSFRLSRHADGRILLTDPTTHRQVDLAAFGDANTRSFARLITIGRT